MLRTIAVMLVFLCPIPGLSVSTQYAIIIPTAIQTQKAPKSLKGPHISVNVYLPKTGHSNILLEVKNNETFDIGLIRFDLSTLGRKGNVEVQNIAQKANAKRIYQIDNPRGMRLESFVIVDEKANSRSPKVYVQFIRP